MPAPPFCQEGMARKHPFFPADGNPSLIVGRMRKMSNIEQGISNAEVGGRKPEPAGAPLTGGGFSAPELPVLPFLFMPFPSALDIPCSTLGVPPPASGPTLAERLPAAVHQVVLPWVLHGWVNISRAAPGQSGLHFMQPEHLYKSTQGLSSGHSRKRAFMGHRSNGAQEAQFKQFSDLTMARFM